MTTATTPDAAPPALAPAVTPRRLPLAHLTAAVVTAGLLYCCYFPLACGWLAWVALVPLLTLARADASKKRIFLCAWAGGLLFYWPVIQWMRHGDAMMYFAWPALATYCALYFPAVVLLVRAVDQTLRLPSALTTPVIWVALEYARAHLATGFSWYLVGHTQHDAPVLLQTAGLAGVYGVSLVVVAVNATLTDLLCRIPTLRRRLGLVEPPASLSLMSLVLTAGLVAGAAGYGVGRLAENEFPLGPKVAVVQGDLDIRLKNEAWSVEPEAKSAAQAMRLHHIRLTELALRTRPDLIAWPETSWPDDWVEIVPLDGGPPIPVVGSPEVGKLVERVSREWKTDVLIGSNTVVVHRDDRRVRWNSAILLHGDGTAGGRFDKWHPVPFGEYVPLRDWLPFMNAFSPYEFDYSIHPGERLTRFTTGQYRFGVMICYDDTLDDLARRYAVEDKDGPAVDFLLNPSNDGWFDGSAEHEEHLAVCRFRAVEARRTVGRAVNMGISGFIDPLGRVMTPVETEVVDGARLWVVDTQGASYRSTTSLPLRRWSEFKKAPGVVVSRVPVGSGSTVYARFGDVLPAGCWVLTIVGLAAVFVRARRAV